jgi:transposase
VFDKLIQILAFGCGYRRIADHTCSATTLRRRRDEWISLGLADRLWRAVFGADDRLFGLELEHLAVDGCITAAPCGDQTAGPSLVDRRKQGLKRSTVTEAGGIPLGAVAARPTVVTTGCSRPPWTPWSWSVCCPPTGGASGRGLRPRALLAGAGRARHGRRDRHAGLPAPVQARRRWPVERTHAWGNQYGKLRWCTERRRLVVAFWLWPARPPCLDLLPPTTPPPLTPYWRRFQKKGMSTAGRRCRWRPA